MIAGLLANQFGQSASQGRCGPQGRAPCGGDWGKIGENIQKHFGENFQKHFGPNFEKHFGENFAKHCGD